MFSVRGMIGALVVAAAALVTAALAIARHSENLSAGLVPPPVSVFEERFGRVRPFLDPGEPVGYFTDLPDSETRSYYMARYVLSPVRVLWQAPCKKAIGDFHSPRFIAAVLNHEGYDIDRDLGQGVYLLKRRTP